MKSVTFMISWHQVKGIGIVGKGKIWWWWLLYLQERSSLLHSLVLTSLPRASLPFYWLTIIHSCEKLLFPEAGAAARSSIHYTDVDCWVLLIEQNSFYLPIECWFDNLARLYCQIRYNLVCAHQLIILSVFRKHLWFIIACTSLPSTTIIDSDLHVRLMVVV